MAQSTVRNPSSFDENIKIRDQQTNLPAQKVRTHLEKTEKEWGAHFAAEEDQRKEDRLLTLAFSNEEKGEKRKEQVQEVLAKIEKILTTEELKLEQCKQLYKEWNKEEAEYKGENDYGGALHVLGKLLAEWENPSQPALTAEQQAKLKDYEEFFQHRPSFKDLKELNTSYDKLEKENEKLRQRELNNNERRIMALFPRVASSASAGMNSRLANARSALGRLKRNDSTSEANPNLLVGNINLAQHLASVLEEIIWICDYHLAEVKKWDETVQELEEENKELKEQLRN